MAVKKKRGNAQPAFAGIVVAGASKLEAINNYRAVASGEDAQALRSSDGKYQMVTLASAEGFHDPLTGNQDMVEVDAQMTSQSSDLNEPVQAFMTICADGCGHVVISDSDKAVSFCPSCSTAIPELSNEDIDRLTAESETEEALEGPSGHQGVIVAANSFEEAEQLFLEAMNGENVVGITDNSDAELGTSESSADQLQFNTHRKCDISYSPFFGEAAVEQDETVVEGFSAEASTEDGETGHKGQYLLCSDDENCGMHVIASNNEAVFCPSCSGSLVDPADIEEMEQVALASDEEDLESTSGEGEHVSIATVTEYEDDDLESTSGDDGDDFEEDEDGDDVDVDMSDDDEDDDSDDDLESTSSDDDLESTSSDDDDEDDDDLGGDFDEDEEESDLEDEDDEDLDELDELDEDDEDFDSESSTQDYRINMLQLIASNEGQLDAANLNVAHCGAIAGVDTWTAFYNGVPVATAKANNVPDSVSSIFNSPKYGQAALASARELGVQEALSSMGFAAIEPEASVEVAVASAVLDEADSRIQKAEASVETQRQEMQESFASALSIAAMGINRGVFAGYSNPIFDNLVASLSAAGIKDPAPLVQSAFERGADSFAKTLLAKAKDINSKSPEVQNQIAESVSQTNFLAAQASTQGAESIGTVVAATEQPVAQPVQKPMQSESSASDMRSMISGLKLGR